MAVTDEPDVFNESHMVIFRKKIIINVCENGCIEPEPTPSLPTLNEAFSLIKQTIPINIVLKPFETKVFRFDKKV